MAAVRLMLIVQFATCLAFSEERSDYPRWDGRETIESYAQRVGLPARNTILLPGGGSLELVLVPAAEFRMGIPVPDKPVRTVYQPFPALFLSVISLVTLLVLLVFRALRLRRRFQFSLRHLLLLTISASCLVGTGVDSWLLNEEWQEYEQRQAKSWGVEDSQKPAHWVIISRPFYLSVTEVSRAQYTSVCGATPLAKWVPIRGDPDVVPVLVDFDGARAFCRALQDRHHQAYRLPTEAEFELACSHGQEAGFCSHRHEAGRIDCLAYGGRIPPLGPIGCGAPNTLGLRDLEGNAWEWCSDWLGRYPDDPVDDPHGAAIGDERVVRGVERVSTGNPCFPSCRWSQRPTCLAGIRLALDVRDVAAVREEERRTDKTVEKRELLERIQLNFDEIENCVVSRTWHEVEAWTEAPADPRRCYLLRQQLRHFNEEGMITSVAVAVLETPEEAQRFFQCRATGQSGFWDADLSTLGDESLFTCMGSRNGRQDRFNSEVFIRSGRLYMHVQVTCLREEPMLVTRHFRDIYEAILDRYTRLEQPVQAAGHQRR